MPPIRGCLGIGRLPLRTVKPQPVVATMQGAELSPESPRDWAGLRVRAVPSHPCCCSPNSFGGLPPGEGCRWSLRGAESRAAAVAPLPASVLNSGLKRVSGASTRRNGGPDHCSLVCIGPVLRPPSCNTGVTFSSMTPVLWLAAAPSLRCGLPSMVCCSRVDLLGWFSAWLIHPSWGVT